MHGTGHDPDGKHMGSENGLTATHRCSRIRPLVSWSWSPSLPLLAVQGRWNQPDGICRPAAGLSLKRTVRIDRGWPPKLVGADELETPLAGLRVILKLGSLPMGFPRVVVIGSCYAPNTALVGALVRYFAHLVISGIDSSARRARCCR
jgi:hypothetical protein